MSLPVSCTAATPNPQTYVCTHSACRLEIGSSLITLLYPSPNTPINFKKGSGRQGGRVAVPYSFTVPVKEFREKDHAGDGNP